MKKYLTLSVFFLFVLANVSAAPFSFSKTPVDVLASVTVNKKTQTVTKKDLNEKIAEYKKAGIDVSEDEVLEVLVNDRVFLMSAERDKVEVTNAEVEERIRAVKDQLSQAAGAPIKDEDFNSYLAMNGVSLEQYKNDLKDTLLVDKYVRSKKSAELEKPVNVSDSDIKSFYRKNQSQFVNPEYVRLSHIFMKKTDNATENVKIKNRLSTVLDDIESNKITFEKAVSKYSEDEGSSTRGGDIGNVTASNSSEILGDDFVNEAFELEPGEICGKVLESPTGYHIIKATAHVEQKFLSIDDYTSPDSSTTVREYIRAGLQQQKAQENYAEVVNSFIEDLKKSAKITYSNK